MANNKRQTLENTKGKTKTRRAKPLVAKSGIPLRRTPYKYGGKADK